MELDAYTNYFFAFSHGVIHPLTILRFTSHRWRFAAVILAIGVVTFLEYWLLVTRLGFPFASVKTVLALTTAVIGIGFVLGGSARSLVGAAVVGLALALFSDSMISLDVYRPNWSIMFPLLVAGQLAIYFLGFLTVRALISRNSLERHIPEEVGADWNSL